VIGLGRTMGGDFLSSEDVELLESLASYIGIALQNASLYARLGERSASSSGSRSSTRILSNPSTWASSRSISTTASKAGTRRWRPCMPEPRGSLGQELRAVFPSEFIDALEEFRNEPGVHHLYKFRLTTRAGEQRTANIAIAPAALARFCAGGPHHSGRRHHGARDARNAAGAGGQAQLHRPARRRRGA
jgi:two-component system NtrC family sensor kinase